MPAWLTDLVILAPWLAALGLAGWVGVKVWPTIRKLMHFVDDVAGEGERPGQPARAGLMERIAAIEAKQTHVEQFVEDTEAHRAETARTLAEIRKDTATSRHQLVPNGGGSVIDQVVKLHQKVDRAIAWQKKHEKKSDAVVTVVGDAVARITALEQDAHPPRP